MITIKYNGRINDLATKKEDVFDVVSVSEVLKKIKAIHGQDAYICAKRSHILVNGTNITVLKGLRTKLEHKDTVTFLPVCGGG